MEKKSFIYSLIVGMLFIFNSCGKDDFCECENDPFVGVHESDIETKAIEKPKEEESSCGYCAPILATNKYEYSIPLLVNTAYQVQQPGYDKLIWSPPHCIFTVNGHTATIKFLHTGSYKLYVTGQKFVGTKWTSDGVKDCYCPRASYTYIFDVTEPTYEKF